MEHLTFNTSFVNIKEVNAIRNLDTRNMEFAAHIKNKAAEINNFIKMLLSPRKTYKIINDINNYKLEYNVRTISLIANKPVSDSEKTQEVEEMIKVAKDLKDATISTPTITTTEILRKRKPLKKQKSKN